MAPLSINRVLIFISLIGISLLSVPKIYAQQRVINLNANDLLPHSEITVTPQSGTFQENSTFDVPIFLNTRGNSVNAIELHLKFDQNKLSVVKPSGGKSIIGIWVDPPSYDNVNGSVKAVGTIPGGIKTGSGLILTVTFKAKISGQANVTIQDLSQVLLNDGLGTPTILDTTRGSYTIVPQPPGGVEVYSDTHPFQDHWYNNTSPVFSWNKDPDVSGFSFIINNDPNTIPPSNVSTTSTFTSYDELGDGVWYFHIKAIRKGVWGATTHYAVRIDTVPPAQFTPTVEYVTAAVINRFLITFGTTDSLSGMNHFEVGVLDKNEPTTVSPTFIQTESPYQVPTESSGNVRVIVRAIDNANNIRDESIDVKVPKFFISFISQHEMILLESILVIIVLSFIIHYLYGHHVIRRLRRVRELMKRERI
jgi:hypothetical protein